MHIALMLAKMDLIRQRNYAELGLLQNSASERGMLNAPSFGSLESATNFETNLETNNELLETQLMAVNAELNAINQYNSNSNSKLNYKA